MMSTRARFFTSVALAFAILYLISLQRLAGLFFGLALVGMVITGQEIALWRSERRERARLIRDAERQHAAWKAGDDDWGVYGISPTASTVAHECDGHCILSCAEQKARPPVVVSTWGHE